ncbi:amino acid ABC transporter substrate-binding protein [Pullulanibacillus sp. KACC 23026]|uniref:amino acid ABC transporter substrate-binding protein n=1 Tax=Pullulanibacillus sp. KACC 23026 TaxID=3028315 RepID=UPI0023B0AD59|nr:amino acid ABC transporter substrate-binding protein [Pullulanibacillus sp. KACC 23026]WEG12097.1 amino acid ABC transporter substrate-binding protein [Pullulanibacillus sp. KACC 23026]
MKKSLIFLVTLMVFFSLTACGSGKNKANTTNLYQSIQSKGVITIGTEGTYPPFTYHDSSDKLTGFDVEIAQEVAKRLGVKAKFIETKWDGMLAGLDDKRYDMVANEVGITPDRQKKYLFSRPYIASKAALIVKQDNNTIKTFKDLKGKKVAQSLTSNYYNIAKSYGAVNTQVDGFNQAVDLITSGRVDATVNDSLSYLDMKKQNPNAPIKMVAEQSNAAKSAFLFRKGSTALVQKVNKALADMKKDGTYLKISKKYFGQDVSK